MCVIFSVYEQYDRSAALDFQFYTISCVCLRLSINERRTLLFHSHTQICTAADSAYEMQTHLIA